MLSHNPMMLKQILNSHRHVEFLKNEFQGKSDTVEPGYLKLQ